MDLRNKRIIRTFENGSPPMQIWRLVSGSDSSSSQPNAWQVREFLVNGFCMATYTYETIPGNPKSKPRRFEIQQKMSDPPLKNDPETGLPVRRVITGGSGNIYRGVSILSMNVKRGRKS